LRNQVPVAGENPAGGPAADEGVLPTFSDIGIPVPVAAGTRRLISFVLTPIPLACIKIKEKPWQSK
jgi:hypothetical protein